MHSLCCRWRQVCTMILWAVSRPVSSLVILQVADKDSTHDNHIMYVLKTQIQPKNSQCSKTYIQVNDSQSESFQTTLLTFRLTTKVIEFSYKNENNNIYLQKCIKHHCKKNIEIYMHKNIFLYNKCNIIQLFYIHAQSYQHCPTFM